jgi:hypothetical protein
MTYADVLKEKAARLASRAEAVDVVVECVRRVDTNELDELDGLK